MSRHLIYYRTEREKLANTKYDKQISLIEAVGLVYFISLKFKIREPQVLFRGGRTSSCFKYPETLVFKKSYLDSGVVSHEFAHYMQFVKTGQTRHDNRMFKYVKRIQRYVDTLI
jgi:hypothetical protein